MVLPGFAFTVLVASSAMISIVISSKEESVGATVSVAFVAVKSSNYTRVSSLEFFKRVSFTPIIMASGPQR